MRSRSALPSPSPTAAHASSAWTSPSSEGQGPYTSSCQHQPPRTQNHRTLQRCPSPHPPAPPPTLTLTLTLTRHQAAELRAEAHDAHGPRPRVDAASGGLDAILAAARGLHVAGYPNPDPHPNPNLELSPSPSPDPDPNPSPNLNISPNPTLARTLTLTLTATTRRSRRPPSSPPLCSTRPCRSCGASAGRASLHNTNPKPVPSP